jgi:hypothetical protein
MSHLISHAQDSMFTFVDAFDDRLRQDYFLKNILIMTILFQKREGLTNGDVIERESRVYHKILESYVTALVRGGHCIESADEMLYNIHITRSRLSFMIPFYEKMPVKT